MPDRTLNLCAPVEGWIEATPQTGDGQAPSLRRFSMVAYTGGPMVVAGWPHPVVVDLSGMQVAGGGLKSRPILKDHNRSLIVGHTDAVKVEGAQLLVSGVISGAGPVAREIVDSSRNGFPWQASLGAVAGQMELVPKGKKASANGREFEGPVLIARKSTLGEVSFVALGADDNTSAAVAAGAASPRQSVKEDGMTFEQWLEAKGFDPASLTDTQKISLQAMFDVERTSDTPNPGDGAGDIGWVIVGGESGPGARPCNVEWIRSIVHQCADAGVACFVKQLGSKPGFDQKVENGFFHPRENGLCIKSMNDHKGGDPAEWPEDLRVREWPVTQR